MLHDSYTCIESFDSYKSLHICINWNPLDFHTFFLKLHQLQQQQAFSSLPTVAERRKKHMAWIHKASPDPGKTEAHPWSVMFDDRTLNDGSFRVLSIVGVGEDA